MSAKVKKKGEKKTEANKGEGRPKNQSVDFKSSFFTVILLINFMFIIKIKFTPIFALAKPLNGNYYNPQF